jgi:ArsR family transcriptional regulator
MIENLGRGERSAGELTALVGLEPSTVSKHLALLKAHGIVADRRSGRQVFYRLHTPCVTKFLTCSRQVLRERKR